MLALIVVGIGVVGALGFVIAGLRLVVIAAFALEKRLHILESRPVYAQFEATLLRIDETSAAIQTVPQLWTRARVAFEGIQNTRSQLQSAARGVGFAARMARAVWDGPKRS